VAVRLIDTSPRAVEGWRTMIERQFNLARIAFTPFVGVSGT
jgi:hypothetical protein